MTVKERLKIPVYVVFGPSGYPSPPLNCVFGFVEKGWLHILMSVKPCKLKKQYYTFECASQLTTAVFNAPGPVMKGTDFWSKVTRREMAWFTMKYAKG